MERIERMASEFKCNRCPRQKRPGTCRHTTTDATWMAMFKAFVEEEITLEEVAKRFRVNYSATYGRARRSKCLCGLCRAEDCQDWWRCRWSKLASRLRADQEQLAQAGPPGAVAVDCTLPRTTLRSTPPAVWRAMRAEIVESAATRAFHLTIKRTAKKYNVVLSDADTWARLVARDDQELAAAIEQQAEDVIHHTFDAAGDSTAHQGNGQGLSAESVEIASIVERFPRETRGRFRDCVRNLADVYRASGICEEAPPPPVAEQGLATVIQLFGSDEV